MKVKITDSNVVRRFASARTHILNTAEEYATKDDRVFGADYTAVSGTALCGVRLAAAVVMQPGSHVYCHTCKYLAGLRG